MSAAPLAAADVELRFKGDRTYLHGTDVYTMAVASLRRQWPGLDGRCRFTFHRLTRVPLAVTLGTFSEGRASARPPGCVAEMHVTGGAAGASIWFTERGGAVTERYTYDEDAVVREAIVDGHAIALKHAPDHAPVEVIVAMTKRLHYALAPPARGRWLFTRLDLVRLLRDDDRERLTVTLASAPRAAVTRSEIVAGDERLGSIFFSVGAA